MLGTIQPVDWCPYSDKECYPNHFTCPSLYRDSLIETEKEAFDEAVAGVLEEHVNSAAAKRWREWGAMRLYGDFVNVHGFYTELERGAAMDYVRKSARRFNYDMRREGKKAAASEMVITRNKVELFCRMKRVLKMSGGHLVGRGRTFIDTFSLLKMRRANSQTKCTLYLKNSETNFV